MKQILFLVISVVICCQISAGELFLWQVSRTGTPGIVYIGGTIHAAIPSLYPLDRKYDEIFNNTDYLVLEIYENAVQKKISQALAVKHLLLHGMLPDQQQLSEIIPPGKYKQYYNYAMMLNLSQETWSSLQYFKPSLLAIQLDVSGLNLTENCSVDIGVDNIFKNLAEKKKIKIKALETTLSQTEVITGMSDREALVLLDHLTGRKKEQIQQENQKTFQAFQTGDPKFYLENASEMKEKIPDFYNAINNQRNQKMVPKILKMLEQKDKGLIMIGLAHLIGEDSLLRDLQQAGCTVQPISADGQKGCLTLLSACQLSPGFYRIRYESNCTLHHWRENKVLTENILRFFTGEKINAGDQILRGKIQKISVSDADGNEYYWGVLQEKDPGNKRVWFRWQDYSGTGDEVPGNVCYRIEKGFPDFDTLFVRCR